MTLADEDVNFLLSVWRAQVKSVHFHIKWEPVRARSLFKFMEVLRVEVWLAILAALIVTALMLWFLDRYIFMF